MIEKSFMYTLIFLFAPFYGSTILNFENTEWVWYLKPVAFIYPPEGFSIIATLFQSGIVGILPSVFITSMIVFGGIRLFEMYLERPVRIG